MGIEESEHNTPTGEDRNRKCTYRENFLTKGGVHRAFPNAVCFDTLLDLQRCVDNMLLQLCSQRLIMRDRVHLQQNIQRHCMCLLALASSSRPWVGARLRAGLGPRNVCFGGGKPKNQWQVRFWHRASIGTSSVKKGQSEQEGGRKKRIYRL